MFSLACSNDHVRLVDGANPREGRVEFCYNEDWGTVCDDAWGISNARVVCRQLGFSTTGVTAYSSAAFGQGTGRIVLDDVRCVGTESRLAYCPANPIGNHDCSHGEDAGVRCTSGTFEGVHENFQLVACWEFCPLSECPLLEVSL